MSWAQAGDPAKRARPVAPIARARVALAESGRQGFIFDASCNAMRRSSAMPRECKLCEALTTVAFPARHTRNSPGIDAASAVHQLDFLRRFPTRSPEHGAGKMGIFSTIRARGAVASLLPALAFASAGAALAFSALATDAGAPATQQVDEQALRADMQ